MQLQYDDDFVEGAVFVCANGRRLVARPRDQVRVAYTTQTWSPPALQVARFHRERERLYSILDPDERNTAFFKLHLEWFREWGLEKALIGVADEFPLFRSALGALVFRKARVKSDEGAELYVQGGTGESAAPFSRSAVVALRVERFERPDELTGFLRHEFMHVHDMVNPAFGYSPQLPLPGHNPAQRRLTRERYRLLWDITIDGRLGARASGAVTACESHRVAFDRGFGFWPETKRDEVFASLRDNPRPRHADLLAIASDPRDLRSAQEPTPGAPCPLCGFATFQWAATGSLGERTQAAIHREFPDWTPDQGACGRCVEIYRLMGAQLVETA